MGIGEIMLGEEAAIKKDNAWNAPNYAGLDRFLPRLKNYYEWSLSKRRKHTWGQASSLLSLCSQGKEGGCQIQMETLVQDLGDQDAFPAFRDHKPNGILSINSFPSLIWGSGGFLLLVAKNIWPKNSNSKVDEQQE